MPAIQDAVGGARPWGTDVVYAMTSDNIANAAGYAECIGGVRFGGHAFAVGEAAVEADADTGPGNNKSAKIAAHEIAHLLGAHHHYANCAEAPRDPGGGITMLVSEACTMMINDVGLASLGWSTLESSVVRGHVERFAIGAKMGPEPKHERELVFRINKKGVGKGTIHSEVAQCIGTSAVSLQRKTSGQWSTVAEVESNPTADYTFEGPLARGIYRTSVSDSYFEGETHRESCPAVVSPEVKVPG
jgi:hypothetical protein